MQKSRADGVAMLQKMTMRPVINGEARARLGKSDYEKCVAPVLQAVREVRGFGRRDQMEGTSSSTRPVKSTPR